MTDIKQRPLKELCPPLSGDFYVKAEVTSDHERFINELWNWLGKRCVFCGGTEEKLMLVKEQKLVCTGHFCHGWLAQLNKEKNVWKKFDRKLEFLSAKLEFLMNMLSGVP